MTAAAATRTRRTLSSGGTAAEPEHIGVLLTSVLEQV